MGVVLFSPERMYLKALLNKSNDRVHRFFDQKNRIAFDDTRFNTLKTAFEERIEAESLTIKTIDQFRQFVRSRANQLLLTDLGLLKYLIQKLSLLLCSEN
ncbi:MAG: hypothetical protein AB1489_35015 [Acidobacteriota bacterium]